MGLGSFAGGFAGAGAGAVLVEILGTDAGLKASLASADRDIATFSKSTAASTGGFASAMSKSFLLVGAAAIGFAAISIKAYQEHAAALIKLQQIIKSSPALIGSTTEAFETQARTLEHLTGIYDTDIIAADAVLGRYNLTQQQIQQIIPLVLDYSRATGVDAATAAGNLGRALLGNARALKAIGINFKATGNTAKDYDTILAALDQKVKGLAEAYLQTHPQLAFQVAMHDLAVTAGQDLLPAVTALSNVLAHDLIPLLLPLAHNLVTLLAVFLGYKALMFLPGLLASVGASFVTMGAAAEAAGISKLGLGLIGLSEGAAALVGPIGLAAIALIGIGLALKNTDGNAVLLAEHFKSVGNGAIGVGRVWESNNKQLTQSFTQLSGGVSEADFKTAQFEAEQEKAAQATNKVAAAIVAQKLALTSLSGGFIGIRGASLATRSATLSYAQALQTLHKDQKTAGTTALQLKQDHLAVAQAMLGRVTAQQSLTSTIEDFVNKELTAGVATDKITNQVKAFAHQAGLTKGETNDLITSVKGLITQYGMIPSSVSTKVEAPGLENQFALIHAYANILNSLNGRQINVYLHEHRPGPPGFPGGGGGGRSQNPGHGNRGSHGGGAKSQAVLGSLLGGGGASANVTVVVNGSIMGSSPQDLANALAPHVYKALGRHRLMTTGSTKL